MTRYKGDKTMYEKRLQEIQKEAIITGSDNVKIPYSDYEWLIKTLKEKLEIVKER